MRKSYGQYCPVARAADLLSKRWTLLLLRDILGGVCRFNDIRQGVPLMSPSLLSKRLKEFEQHGLVVRRQVPGSRAVEYRPTAAALELRSVIFLLGAWGQRWLREGLDEEELDESLLMWDISMMLDASEFGSGQTVIKIEYTDRPRLKKDNWWTDEWWLVVKNGEVDLCVQDPGFDIDLYIVSDLRTMTSVWLDYTPLHDALGAGLIELHGSRPLAETFERWWPRSVHTQHKPPPAPLDLQKIINAAQAPAK